ncbi:uncharacterized protein LOC134830667 [Culicoides brevitarsis]|uniref:uncharacterized protein LOC134830667 n=1 Tax=Culicoides brevitarsis TaxID=469753 RepID=UPI00307C8053
MALLQSVAIASIIFLVVLVQSGIAIRCYECNSHNDSRCAMDIPPEELSIDCEEHKSGVKYTFCRKTTQVIEFSVNNLPPDSRIIRGCGWDDSNYKGRCYQRSGFGGRQEVCACYDDNCNSASSVSLGFGLIAASLAVIYGLF